MPVDLLAAMRAQASQLMSIDGGVVVGGGAGRAGGMAGEGQWRSGDTSCAQFGDIVDPVIVADAARCTLVGASALVATQDARGAVSAVATFAECVPDEGWDTFEREQEQVREWQGSCGVGDSNGEEAEASKAEKKTWKKSKKEKKG